MLKDVSDAKVKFEAYKSAKDQINEKFKELKKGIKFDPVLSPTTIVELETAVPNPTNPSNSSSPGNYEQNRKDFLEKLRARRKGIPPSP